MVVEKIADGAAVPHYVLNNKMSLHNNVLIGKTGTIRVDVPIISSGDTPKVRLYFRGMKAGATAGRLNHGTGAHNHDMLWTLQSGNASAMQSNGTAGGTAAIAVDMTYDYTDNTDARGRFSVSADDSQHPTRNIVPDTGVPKFIQIWIDGTQYTATIGDPNSKGVTMYSAGNGWGVDGTTEWNSGELDLSSLISWTQGEHYIEFKETGDKGGTLIYLVLVD